jgi:hypothetical protein
MIDELFEVDDYLHSPLKSRLAFREFGTCLGIASNEQSQDASRRSSQVPVSAAAIADGPGLAPISPSASTLALMSTPARIAEDEQAAGVRRTFPGIPMENCIETIIRQWEPCMVKPVPPNDLRPITLVMYAAALIPGGEFLLLSLL